MLRNLNFCFRLMLTTSWNDWMNWKNWTLVHWLCWFGLINVSFFSLWQVTQWMLLFLYQLIYPGWLIWRWLTLPVWALDLNWTLTICFKPWVAHLLCARIANWPTSIKKYLLSRNRNLAWVLVLYLCNYSVVYMCVWLYLMQKKTSKICHCGIGKYWLCKRKSLIVSCQISDNPIYPFYGLAAVILNACMCACVCACMCVQLLLVVCCCN